MKVRRYKISAKPERTVVQIPILGNRTLVSSLMRAMRQESIPRDAKISTVHNSKGLRSLRVEWPTAHAVATA